MTSKTLQQMYKRDRNVWDCCAQTYEEQIVGGHPDIVAYETFEADLLDRILIYLMREQGKALQLFDVGCGSARMHLRYGLKMTKEDTLSQEMAAKVVRARWLDPGYQYDPLFNEKLVAVEGLDFSREMIDLAKSKLVSSGLADLLEKKLFLLKGSAFEIVPMQPEPLPVVFALCNTIGVMQGPEGAGELFKSLRRAVEYCGGIAVISGYRKDSVKTFALGNYESTLDVCGQPTWLNPDKYAGEKYLQIPHEYKRAFDTDQQVEVDVYYKKSGKLAKRSHVLNRNPKIVEKVADTGHITTYTDYESRWYSIDHFAYWIKQMWPNLNSYHIQGRELDALRAWPMQLAILDPRELLRDLFDRWKVLNQ